MPIYTFKNKKTNEVYDKTMTYDELQLYVKDKDCLLYTSPSPRDGLLSRMPSSA